VKKDTKAIVNFLFEVGILSKTPRSGFYFLGSGEQSVAEHMNRTVYAGFVLGVLAGADTGKIMKMCLFHDIAEARTSDLNYVHQKYTKADEESALREMAQTVTFGNEIQDILKEYKERKTKEAILAKDADNIEWILSLKEQVDIGNKRAETWIPSAIKRLKTKEAKMLAVTIVKTKSDEWWFSDKEDSWWVTRNKPITSSKRKK
jgi:putative hydrolases of HD superfamily